MKRVAGIDIGFANTGISIFDVKDSVISYIDSECFKSKKIKKSKDYVSAQDADRILSMMKSTVLFLRANKVELVVLELPTGGAKSSRAARALGIATAMCVFIPMYLDIPYMFVSPREVKIATTGDQYAEKDSIISAMSKRFPQILKHNKGKMEHIADSIGTVLARIDKIK